MGGFRRASIFQCNKSQIWPGRGRRRHSIDDQTRLGEHANSEGDSYSHDDTDTNPNAKSYPHADAYTDPSSCCHGSGPAGCRRLCKCAALRPTWNGDDAIRQDIAEYRVLNRSRLQVRAVYRSGFRAKAFRCGRQRLLDMDRWKPYNAGSVADLRYVRIGQRPDLHHRYLEGCAASSSLAAMRSA
jgi:hypothetical protein